jgi:hypothetical protein
VQIFEPERTLVLGDDAGSMSWAFVLQPAGEHSTRLITRSRAGLRPPGPRADAQGRLAPVHFRMQRRQAAQPQATGGGVALTVHRQGTWTRINLLASQMVITMATRWQA